MQQRGLGCRLGLYELLRSLGPSSAHPCRQARWAEALEPTSGLMKGRGSDPWSHYSLDVLTLV